MLRNNRKLILSTEKRVNFALDGSKFRAYARAHEHFLLHLSAEKPTFDVLTGDTISASIYDARKISIDFPQYFQYERNKDLELWEISIK